MGKINKCPKKDFSSYALLLLLMGGDIEINPGPNNWYSLGHPNMCGYFRTALHIIFTKNKKLIPIEESDLTFRKCKTFLVNILRQKK